MAGELDLAASVCAHEMHASDPGPRAETVVCDLGALSFIDVSGVRVLVDAADYAHGRGTPLAIVNVPPVASRVLGLLSLYERLGTAPLHGAEMDVNGREVNTAAEGVRWTEVLRGAGRGAVGAMAMTG
jgi:anti-anti-sigma factor